MHRCKPPKASYSYNDFVTSAAVYLMSCDHEELM